MGYSGNSRMDHFHMKSEYLGKVEGPESQEVVQKRNENGAPAYTLDKEVPSVHLGEGNTGWKSISTPPLIP